MSWSDLVVLLHGDAEEHHECFVEVISRHYGGVSESLSDNDDEPSLLVITSQGKNGPGLQDPLDGLTGGVPVVKPGGQEVPDGVAEVVLLLERIGVVVAAAVEDSAMRKSLRCQTTVRGLMCHLRNSSSCLQFTRWGQLEIHFWRARTASEISSSSSLNSSLAIWSIWSLLKTLTVFSMSISN